MTRCLFPKSHPFGQGRSINQSPFYLIRPDLVALLRFNGSRLAALLNEIGVSEARAVTKWQYLKEGKIWGFHLVVDWLLKPRCR